MRAYAARFGEDAETGASSACSTTSTTSAIPDMDADDGHPRTRWPSSSEMDVPEEWSARSPRTPTSSASRARPPMEKTLYAVDELSGFVAGLRLRAPAGHPRAHAKSVKKKMKPPAFAAAVDRDDVREGAEELGVDFDEHVAFVIAALEPHADELGLTGAPPDVVRATSPPASRRGRRSTPGWRARRSPGAGGAWHAAALAAVPERVGPQPGRARAGGRRCGGAAVASPSASSRAPRTGG